MDSKLITTIILTIIGSGIIAPFSKSIFDKIFVAYNPDPQKINSGIKKILLFTLRYILPVANLVYVYLSHKMVDKYLVLITSFIFSTLVLNILFDIFFKFIDKLYLNDSSILTRVISVLEKQHGMNQETADTLKSLADIQKDHIKITNKLMDKENSTKE